MLTNDNSRIRIRTTRTRARAAGRILLATIDVVTLFAPLASGAPTVTLSLARPIATSCASVDTEPLIRLALHDHCSDVIVGIALDHS